jgi:osmotically-inducible protein OsmY
MMAQRIITVLLSCSILGGPTFAQSSTQPDNTKVNKADRQPGAVTADQQKMNTSDRDLTKKIRQAIVADKSLSTYAHNVKIISQNGTVTLKGPVRSDAEKATIQAKAAEIAGSADKVDNQISVKQ